MVSDQSPPGGRGAPYARVLLPPVLLMAAATAVAVATVTPPARTAVGVCGGIATLLVLAVAAEAARRGRALHRLRTESGRRIAGLQAGLAGHDERTEQLGTTLVPDAVFRLKQGESPEEVVRAVVDEDPAQRDLPAAHRALLLAVLQAVDDEEALRESTQRAFVNIARRVQAIVHQQSAELRGMEEDHGQSPEVFDDLLRIDHGTALIGRLADSIAVLGGARPGRQWPKPVPLFSVLRGAMSRILEYRRVELHSIVQVAVEGTAVEPLIHACAELLDNATRYSPPQTKVHVTAVEVQSGVAIEIEDGGVSLSEEARERAEQLLSRARAGVGLGDLGETPRLGMAVVGRLAQMYHMQVSLRQSAYGGVRAVLVAPHEMLTSAPASGVAHGIGASAVPRLGDDGKLITAERTTKRRPTGPVSSPPVEPAAPARAPARAPSADADEGDGAAPVVTEWTPMGLPQRRSRVRTPFGRRVAEARAEAAARQNTGPAAAPAVQQTPPPAPAQAAEPEPGLWVEAFMSGVTGRDDTAERADRPAVPAAETGAAVAGRDGADCHVTGSQDRAEAVVTHEDGADEAVTHTDVARERAVHADAVHMDVVNEDVVDEGEPK